ncbi:MAG: STAS domain-containing protein [Candidatus Sulfobium sp.]|jgi:anti-anti-sigma factor
MKATNFKVVSRLAGDVAVVYPQGYLNNLAGESLVKECNSYLSRGVRKVVLNFSGTDFINSIGISLLLHIMEGLQEGGGTLCFTNLSKVHRDTFEMLGLTDHMLVFGDEDEAFRHLDAGSGT